MLRQNLEKREIDPESCLHFDLVAHGPLFQEQPDMESHRPIRNKVAALEKALADDLREAGYDVLNTVKCNAPLCGDLWAAVRNAFATHFPKLGQD